MGSTAVEWGEIDRWAERTGVLLNAWEARTLREMSGAYAGWMSKSEDLTCKPPFGSDTANKLIAAESMRNSFIDD